LKTIDIHDMYEHGLCSKHDRIKILGNGKITLKLEIKAHAFSKSAKEAIEKVQGTVVTL
jgi:large subunit ribosomal protein L15